MQLPGAEWTEGLSHLLHQKMMKSDDSYELHRIHGAALPSMFYPRINLKKLFANCISESHNQQSFGEKTESSWHYPAIRQAIRRNRYQYPSHAILTMPYSSDTRETAILSKAIYMYMLRHRATKIQETLNDICLYSKRHQTKR